jgi:hypothetical protein
LKLGIQPKNIQRLAEIHHPTFVDPQNIRGAIEELSNHGITEPLKVINSDIFIINMNSNTIDEHLSYLEEKFKEDFHQVVNSFPVVVALSPKSIEEKITCLEQQGFENPVDLIAKHPPILGYSIDRINKKIEFLQELGFNNPVGLIEKFPPIFGLSENNIATKVRLLTRVIKLYNIPYTPQEIIEYIPVILGVNIDKMLVLIRVFREFAQNINEVSKTNIVKLLSSNLEDVLLAIDLSSNESDLTIKDIIKAAKEVKSFGATREEKQRLIFDGLNNHPKIKRRYFQGYPLKKAYAL